MASSSCSGIGRDINIQPVVSVTEYFDLFVNVTLGIGLVFELPVLIFFLTLLRLVTPGFLIRHSTIRDSRDRRIGGDRYTYTRRFQPDAVRNADVRAYFSSAYLQGTCWC